MNQRTLIMVAVLAIVAISAALLQPRDKYESNEVSEVFLPGLREQANELNGLGLYTGGGIPLGQFSRVDDRWISSNPAGYPADWDNIRELIASLAEASVIEIKTANPDYYDRLGVRDTSDPEAAGVRVDLASETTTWSAIIGMSAESRQGQYARIPGEPASVLLDQEISLSLDPIGWLEQDIVNLPAAEVASVTIEHPDGVVIHISKNSPADSDYVLSDVPEGQTARTGYMVNAIAGGLADLEMQEVRATDGIEFSGGSTARFECFDGRVVMARLITADEKSWISVAAEYSSPADGTQAADAEALVWVERLNSAKSAWVFALPDYKFDVLSREFEELLESADE